MATIEKALIIAANSHQGVVDKEGKPYILHPLRVMMGVEGEAAKIVAILHDVVEDTEVTFQDLEAEGFSTEVLEALKLVTHGEDQTYAEYVVACKPNPIARAVKLSDLKDNSSLERVMLRPENFQWDSARIHRYLLSHRYLTDRISEEDYLHHMAKFEKGK
ncbi:GTP pyrophosphokinase [Planctomycetales bacterium 10988]|nr:GTP pyrophosphokinase [Planctomycetales bacterium 10988]